MSTIRAEGLFKIFGSHPERALEPLRDGEDRDEVHERTGQLGAVIDANFEVAEGELFVIMGLSGSGKSTLVRMINRLFEPTAGKVWIGDTDVLALDTAGLRNLRAGTVSMVFQRFALFPHMSIIENVAWGLEVQDVPAEERARRAAEALETVGLSGWEANFPKQLSGGMQQRVGLARALATDAEVLLMDEPFSALDPLIKRDMQTLLIELQNKLKKTIIFITHDLNEAMRVGDRISVMKAGRIEQTGEPDEILANPATRYVAEFVRDVDRSRVLTVGGVMVDPIATLSPRHQPRAALAQLRHHQASELFVVGTDKQLVGGVRDEDLRAAVDRGERSLESVVHQDFAVVEADTPLQQTLMHSAHYTLPLAVCDERQRLIGVVPRVTLLTALGAETRDTNGAGNGAGEPSDTEASPPAEAADAAAAPIAEQG